MTIKKSSKCPNCDKQRLVPIVYGFPGGTLMQLADQGPSNSVAPSSVTTIHSSTAPLVITASGRKEEPESQPEGTWVTPVTWSTELDFEFSFSHRG